MPKTQNDCRKQAKWFYGVLFWKVYVFQPTVRISLKPRIKAVSARLQVSCHWEMGQHATCDGNQAGRRGHGVISILAGAVRSGVLRSQEEFGNAVGGEGNKLMMCWRMWRRSRVKVMMRHKWKMWNIGNWREENVKKSLSGDEWLRGEHERKVNWAAAYPDYLRRGLQT